MLDWPQPQVTAGAINGEVISVDSFGNLVTNISRTELPEFAVLQIEFAGRRIPVATTYADVGNGALLALVGSGGLLEIAESGGSAAAQLGVGVGEPIVVKC